MRSAPMAIAWSRNALNLISALQRTSGFGVRPARYSARKLANTRSRYSAAKFTASMSMPMRSAAAAASTRSSRDEQCSSSSSSSQFFMKRPTTSWPARLRRSAATAESTPPERPTTIFMSPSSKARRRGASPAFRCCGEAPQLLLHGVLLHLVLLCVGLHVGLGFRVGLHVGLGRLGGLVGLLLGLRFHFLDLLLLGVVLLHVVLVHLRRGRGGRGGSGGRGRGRLRAGRFRGLGGFGGSCGSGLRERGQRRGSEQRGDQGGQLGHRFFLGGYVERSINVRLRWN